MIIDSKGKLFGKISIIDILILVVLIAGIAGVWVKFFQIRFCNTYCSKKRNLYCGTLLGRIP